MNKIGIVGYGKMGKEIFHFYYPQCKNTSFVVFCRHGKEQHRADLERELQKMLRRKRITEEIFEFQRENLRFTDNLSDFSDCDMVIESVAEDIDVKKSIFTALEKIVTPGCLLLTNTSSLSIERIFGDISARERCFGLHFFYPLKLTSFVELNLLPQNPPEIAECVSEWVESHRKCALKFREPYHMYLNQFIFTAISTAIFFRNESGCPVNQLENAFGKFFPTGGIFGLIDSIGLELLTKNAGAFRMKRTENLHSYGISEMKKWTDSGFSEEPNTFLAEICEREKNIPEKEICFPPEYLIALLMNEAVSTADECGIEPEMLFEALQESVGTAETFAEYYGKIGGNALRNMIAELHRYRPDFFPQPNEEEKWENYFNKEKQL
ncbi:MAG: 3-hydroxyacyl-CoA dehydrogenase family protein [Ruminococcus flavefaciens]|nr:3-hydroxyacyl-CoA dehydrogenase family protein [Ruminococcus flavefaciens]MCM1232617.1 3-hydroxyacyl-CoA dehydrogenase family protein [Ruminococcus flavefaciens]